MKIFCKIPKNTFIVSENQIKNILSEGKTIILNSSQIKQISEAMNDTFSYEELGNIRALSKRVTYYKQHLGNPIDDEKVLLDSGLSQQVWNDYYRR